MEHEVFVPVPARQLRAVLADPARVARAIPGLQREAGEDALAGRLKVRIGKHSVTYRGSLRVTGRDDGTYAVAGEGTEVRGTGSAGLALTLRVRDAEGGAVLAFEGTATAGGRVAELAPESVSTAVTRLLNRFAEALAEQGPAEDGEPPQTAETLATQDFAPLATGDFETTPDAEDAPVPPAAAEPARDAGNASSPPTREAGDADAPEGAGAGDTPAVPAASSVFEAEVPPPSLDPLADEEEGELGEEAPEARDEEAEEQAERDDVLEPALPEGAGEELGEPLPEDAAEDFGEPAEPPAEAAHARRTMIGRSAEEVDHAPPRGRYAPVPAPLTVSGNPALRWAAPAAALAVASAIIVGRALRRRR
ncbi:SRPBCC domain-containing protein [Streptomyces naganishii]|uniref:SRPBCC domain-containing protein n=1 Tax=Streptomyces naganishii TaxID=285447 RepID=UPI0036B5C8D9